MKTDGVLFCVLLTLAWCVPARAENVPPSLRPRFPEEAACPESPLHVYGGSALKFKLAVEAPLGTRSRVKAVRPADGKFLLADRQTGVAVDLAEHAAGKSALENAAAKLTARLVPKLVGE